MDTSYWGTKVKFFLKSQEAYAFKEHLMRLSSQNLGVLGSRIQLDYEGNLPKANEEYRDDKWRWEVSWIQHPNLNINYPNLNTIIAELPNKV